MPVMLPYTAAAERVVARDGLKETEIGCVPSSWAVAPLGNYISEAQYGISVKGGDKGNCPILRMTNQDNGRISKRNLQFAYVSERDLSKFRMKRGDLLFNRTNSFDLVGRTAIFDIEGDYVFASYLIRLRTMAETLDPFFLNLYLNFDATQRRLKSIASRAVSQSNISATRLKGFPIPVPPLPEQRTIVGVLRLVQRAMEQQERLLTLTAELKKALLDQLFTHGLRHEPQKPTELGQIPQSWTVARLDEFCVLQRGFDITKKEQVSGGVPVVSSGGIASYHNVAKVPGPGVVVGRKGTLGKVHFLDVDFWPHDTTLWVKDFKGNDPRFAAFFLETLHFERYNSGASNPTLNRNTVHGELVAFPDPKEQKEIGRILNEVEQKGHIHGRKHAALSALFRTLLHELMTARIRVHNLDLPELEAAVQE